MNTYIISKACKSNLCSSNRWKISLNCCNQQHFEQTHLMCPTKHVGTNCEQSLVTNQFIIIFTTTRAQVVERLLKIDLQLKFVKKIIVFACKFQMVVYVYIFFSFNYFPFSSNQLGVSFVFVCQLYQNQFAGTELSIQSYFFTFLLIN